MALASSCVLLHHRSFAISRSSISKTPIRRTIVPITFKIESVNRCNSALPNIRCCSSSGSSVEAEKYSSTRIFIKGLPLSMSEGCLMKSFSCYGEVRKVKIITDRKCRQSLGLAYVWFASEESAQLAVAEMDGKFFGGRFIAVTIAKPESPTSKEFFIDEHGPKEPFPIIIGTHDADSNPV